jgi:pyridinium-3,5-bisthiocarboxylic acid mononucleotide nickel chelatase
MKTLYLDIFSGISGDMFIGALLDLGVDIHRLEEQLAKLDLHGYHLHATRAKRCQIEGTKFDVHLGHRHEDAQEQLHDHSHPHGHDHDHDHDHGGDHDHDHGGEHGHEDGHEHEHEHGHEHHGGHEHGRDFAEIKRLISQSALSPWVKEKAVAVFERIAAAEGKIHGVAPERVRFHEVGAVDSIIDVVGSCIGLEIMGKPRILAAQAVDGVGWIDCAHGRFPIPAPATLEILAARGVPISQCEEPHELITPTGAALLAELAEEFGPMQSLAPERIGFGVGNRENKTRPNVLRAVLGQTQAALAHDWETDRIEVLETNLDDVSPEILGHFVEAALAAGALDVFYTPIQMKKNRPGVLLSVLCAVADADKFSEMILRQTSAFGIRRVAAERRKLRRRFETVQTRHGEVTIKLGCLDGQVVQITPEYESCKKFAGEKNLPLAEVYRAALAAWRG